MLRLGLVAALMVVGAATTACTPAQTAAAAAAANAFVQDVGDRDWTAACALLSSDAREQLERTAARPCAQALPAVRMPVGPVAAVEVWGHNASADMGSARVFLSLFTDGWRVIGAGCVSRGEDRPYACSVKG